MTTPAATGAAGQDAAPLRPKLTAEQALTRLLELIRTSRYVSDFTPERVSQVMGVETEFAKNGTGEYGYGEQITSDWLQNFGMEKTLDRFMFSFDPVKPGTSPDMTDICQLDFEKFSAELETMGFSKTPHYDSPPFTLIEEDRLPHGRLMDYTFERIRDGRGEMTVMVYPEGDHVWNEQTANGCLCVRMILIH